MAGSSPNVIPFGADYEYERSTRTIIRKKQGDQPELRYDRPSYMKFVGGRWQFFDSALALEIFADELEDLTIPILQTLIPGWVAVQVSLPLIELVGKIRHNDQDDNQNFKKVARRVFPRNSIDPVPSGPEYTSIWDALWAGLRCGLSHCGFMQAAKAHSFDVQIDEDHDAPPIAFFRYPGEKVVQVGAKHFVDKVIAEVRSTVEFLRRNPSPRENRFLPLWRNRWGSHPP